MAAKIAAIRAPHENMLGEVVGRTETLLYRRGNFNGTLDDVICDALLAERDAEIALSPGFRWGNSLLPGPGHHPRGHLQRHRAHLSRRLSHDDDRRAAEGDPGGRRRQPVQPRSLLPAGRRHGPRRRRVLHRSTSARAIGRRISRPAPRCKTGKPLDAGKDYVVAGWASVNEGTEGPPIWDVVMSHIAEEARRRAARSRACARAGGVEELGQLEKHLARTYANLCINCARARERTR